MSRPAFYLVHSIDISKYYPLTHNAALRCDARLATLERSETAKREESLLNALLCAIFQHRKWLLRSLVVECLMHIDTALRLQTSLWANHRFAFSTARQLPIRQNDI